MTSGVSERIASKLWWKFDTEYACPYVTCVKSKFGCVLLISFFADLTFCLCISDRGRSGYHRLNSIGSIEKYPTNCICKFGKGLGDIFSSISEGNELNGTDVTICKSGVGLL